MEVWVLASRANADAVLRALIRFGVPTGSLSKEDYEREGLVLQIGVAPRRIDILTSVSGRHFVDASKHAGLVSLSSLVVPLLSPDDLIRNKRASGRTKNLADAEALERLRGLPDCEAGSM